MQKEHRRSAMADEMAKLDEQRDLLKNDVTLLTNQLKCLEVQKQAKHTAMERSAQEMEKTASRVLMVQQVV